MVERFEEAETEDLNPEKLAYILIGVSLIVRHVTGNDQDYLRKIPRAVVQISALL